MKVWMIFFLGAKGKNQMFHISIWIQLNTTLVESKLVIMEKNYMSSYIIQFSPHCYRASQTLIHLCSFVERNFLGCFLDVLRQMHVLLFKPYDGEWIWKSWLGKNLATPFEVLGTDLHAFVGVARATRCSLETARAYSLASYGLVHSPGKADGVQRCRWPETTFFDQVGRYTL